MAAEISVNRPHKNLIATKAINPRPIPVAIENVSGIESAVITAGAYSVMSSQSTSASPRAIRHATNIIAGAVANPGMDVAIGAKNNARRNKIATTTAVNPVRPPARTPDELSI